MQLSWEKIKADAVREFCSKYTRNLYSNTTEFNVGKMLYALLIERLKNNYTPTRQLIRQIEDVAVEVIERTDIRSYKQLLEICRQFSELD